MKSTPGPWRTVRNKGMGPGLKTDICCPAGWVVARAFHSPNNRPKYSDLWAEAEANARLIAAAPDMLAALEELYVNACDRNETHDKETGEECADWRKCRLALEKAGWEETK